MTVLTLPTGATTGARIVLDGESDRILLYDASNNLVFSVAPDAGTDANGTGYAKGLASYNNLGSAVLQDGGLLLGAGPDFIGAGSLKPTVGGGHGVVLDSGSGAVTAPDSAQLTAQAGDAGQPTGGTGPSLSLKDRANTSAVDFEISGSVVKTNNSGTVETWHVLGNTGQIAYNAGWAQATTFAGVSPVGPFAYRRDALNNLVVLGAAQITAAGASAVPNATALPAGYFDPNHQVGIPVLQKQASGALVAGFGYISNTGNFHLDAGAGFTRNVGDVFYFNGSLPLGNLA